MTEIIVASDSSTDRTDEIVRSFADQGVKLCRTDGRLGKTETLNHAVEQATGDIVVFSDATGVFGQDTLRRIVENFNDPSVGCVGGYVAYHYGLNTNSVGFRAYQRFAVAIRRAETSFGSQITVSGGIHAMRRRLYIPLAPHHSHDIMDAVHTVAQGYRAVYERDAVCMEESRTRLTDEFHSRVRIGLSAMVSIGYILRTMIEKQRWGFIFQFVSHKLLRWWLWSTLIALFVTSIILSPLSWGYGIVLGIQLGFYSMACGRLLGVTSILRIPGQSEIAFFLLGNAAMCVATLKWIRGDAVHSWEPVR